MQAQPSALSERGSRRRTVERLDKVLARRQRGAEEHGGVVAARQQVEHRVANGGVARALQGGSAVRHAGGGPGEGR